MGRRSAQQTRERLRYPLPQHSPSEAPGFHENLGFGPFEAQTERLTGIAHRFLPIRSLGQSGNEQPDLPIHALPSWVAEYPSAAIASVVIVTLEERRL
jgi:hypothetical protein